MSRQRCKKMPEKSRTWHEALLRVSRTKKFEWHALRLGTVNLSIKSLIETFKIQNVPLRFGRKMLAHFFHRGHKVCSSRNTCRCVQGTPAVHQLKPTRSPPPLPYFLTRTSCGRSEREGSGGWSAVCTFRPMVPLQTHPSCTWTSKNARPP